MMASLLIRPIAGKLADEVNKKWLLSLGLGLFLLGPLFYGFLNSPEYFMAIRMLQGLGFALFYTVSTSYITHTLPESNKTEGISYYSNAIKLAMAFSPTLGLWFAKMNQFLWTFGISVGLGILTALAIGGLNPQKSLAHVYENRQGILGHRGKLFNSKAIFPGRIMFANSIVFGALMPFVPLLAQSKGLSSDLLFYTVYAVFLIASRAFTGKWADRHGHHVVIVPGMLLVVISLVLLGWSPNEWLFIFSAGLYGLGAGVVQPSLIALTAESSESHERGSAMATFTMFTDLGIASGAYLMAVVGGAFGYGLSLMGVSLVTLGGVTLFVVHYAGKLKKVQSHLELSSYEISS
jgi:MFS family permease